MSSRFAGLKRVARRRQAAACSRCGRAAAVAPLVVTQGVMTLCECCWMSLVGPENSGARWESEAAEAQKAALRRGATPSVSSDTDGPVRDRLATVSATPSGAKVSPSETRCSWEGPDLRQREPFNPPRVAAALVPLFEAEARARQLSTLKKGDKQPVPANLPDRGEAREKAAEAVNVSPARVSRRRRPTLTRADAGPARDPGAARGAVPAGAGRAATERNTRGGDRDGP